MGSSDKWAARAGGIVCCLGLLIVLIGLIVAASQPSTEVCAVQLFACERSCFMSHLCAWLFVCVTIITGGCVVQVSEYSESVCVCDDCRTAHSIHTHLPPTHMQCSFVSRLHHIHNLYITGEEAVLVHLTISLRCNQAGVDTSGSLASTPHFIKEHLLTHSLSL